MAEEICRRMHFSTYETRQILALVANHMRFKDAERMNQSTLKKFLRLPHFDQHLALHRLDCLASHRNLRFYEFVKQRMASIPPAEVRPQPLVKGDDLIRAGYAPGPRFKEILSAVEDGQLEGVLRSRKDAMEFVLKEFPL
jgi:poly(A) polymerase